MKTIKILLIHLGCIDPTKNKFNRPKFGGGGRKWEPYIWKEKHFI